MPSSIKPRSPTPRVSRTPQPPPISYSFYPTSRPSSQATLTSARSSPSPTPSHGRSHSISKTMHWLSRNSTQSSSPYNSTKPTRISEPKLIRSVDLTAQPRSGTLGTGATVVRTPDEALRTTGVRITFDGKPDNGLPSSEEHKIRNSVTSQKALLPTSLPSPAISATELLPASSAVPLPKFEVSTHGRAGGVGRDEVCSLATEVHHYHDGIIAVGIGEFYNKVHREETEVSKALKPPRPSRAPPSVPHSSLRSSLRMRPVQQVEDVTNVLSLPADLSIAPSPPSFQPILVSEVPTDVVDHSKIIVTIETSTTSYKTTLETLKSRPSYLSDYLRSLFPSDRTSIASSIYSHASEDMSTYRHHLTSRGFLSQVTFSVHLFLDRPSTPYPHIFNYLRSPLSAPDAPEILPRSIQMLSSHQRLESLLELCDEAAYLGLDGLRKLCINEIRLRYGLRLHTLGQNTTTVARSMDASFPNLHALLESVESDIKSNTRNSRSSSSTNANDISADMTISRSLPTPQSWNGSSRRSEEHRDTSPPSGWI